MRVKLQLVMCSDDGQEETITDLVTLQKDSQRIEHLGLTLREAKQLLNTIQRRVLQQQVDAFLDSCSSCPDCGTPLKTKGIIPAHSALYLAPASSPVHVSTTAGASVVKPRRFGLCRLCLPSRLPPNCSLWRRSGRLSCHTA